MCLSKWRRPALPGPVHGKRAQYRTAIKDASHCRTMNLFRVVIPCVWILPAKVPINTRNRTRLPLILIMACRPFIVNVLCHVVKAVVIHL